MFRPSKRGQCPVASFLNGLAGVDSLRGGLGNDGYIVDHVSDQVVESAVFLSDGYISSELTGLKTLSGAAHVVSV